MKAGRELDALVAEKVMGYRQAEDGSWFLPGISTGLGLWELPEYSTSIADAWLVLEQLRAYENTEERVFVRIESCPDGEWDCGLTAWDDCNHEIGIDYTRSVRASTIELAICLAALNAMGVEPSA
jgi:hypothetical protein